MSEMIERLSRLSHKQLMLLALDQQEQIEVAKRREREPIAVVGIGCRFPGGGTSPELFWDMLHEGRDGIREVPPDRWDVDALFDPDPDAPARMSVRSGGFLDDIAGFDAAFFGIAPREALMMDPQQRLLLEIAWEALENAGIAADRLGGSATGVFVGICNGDYFQRLVQRGREQIDPYLASGNAYSVAAGRIAYSLGLQGPAIAVDTSCSASLVALHLACRSLRSRETSLALCGGVNLICSPETNIALSKAHMLAPDGRCKTFDASADGYARGEGCGIIVLRRLSDAIANDERILGVILGTATNQDGRSGGLTVPNGRAQEAVIRAALADAGVEPLDVDYVEAHGTGTSLGDPIEVRAIAAALGAGRSNDYAVTVGSVKTNIGHLESAAGIAGVIKVLLSLQHDRIPPHLHFQQPNVHVDWAAYPVKVAAEGSTWKHGPRRRVAGVSSFGFSGTNAHAVIAEAPPPRKAIEPRALRPLHVVPLSARSGAALKELAGRYLAAVEANPALELADIACTAGIGRSHLPERLAVVAADTGQVAEALRAFVADEPHPALHRGTAVAGSTPEVVFVFTGQGAQHPGMGRLLYEHAPPFRSVIDRADEQLGADEQGRMLKSVLWSGDASDHAIHDTAWTQPALFAVEYGLAKLWQSWGIEPASVIGHSVGEYVAACVAGVFSFDDGLRLIAERGRLMASLPPGGRMAAVFAAESVIRDAIATTAVRASIAAVNGPENIVISGGAPAIDAVLATLAQRGIRGQPLLVSYAAHSSLVEPALDAMEAVARKVPMQAPNIPVAWNLTGGKTLPAGAPPDGSYWRRHLREPVRFADGMKSLHDAGWRTFLEIGPHPTLTALARQSLPEEGTRFLWSLRRERNDWQEILGSLAELYVHGAAIDWTGVEKPYGGRRIALPTYPFERRHFWVTPPQPFERSVAAPPGEDLFYDVVWEAAPPVARAASFLIPPERFAANLQTRFATLADRHGLAVYDELLPELDRLSARYVVTALGELGFEWTVGRLFLVGDEASRLRIADRHHRLFARMLDMLVEEGALRRRGDHLEVVAPVLLSAPKRPSEALLTRFASTDSELRLLARCGAELASVLQGRQDPLALLFPGGSFAEATRLYREAPYALTYNAAIGEAVTAAIQALPANARLRMLEVGAGTGGTTAPLLKLLPADGVEYTFTDLSPRFLQQAAEQFADFPFLRRAMLDIARDPAAQGFTPGNYDVVIAANVLHATPDLRQTVQHIRSLLAPGGLLVLLEGTTPERWVDLTFGLTEGWWSFTDTALRPSHPLISRQAWTGLLSELGFTDVTTVPDGAQDRRSQTQQALIVARAPARGRRWIVVGDRHDMGGALAAALRARGDIVTLLPADADPAAAEPGGTLVYLGALELADRPEDDPLALDACRSLSCTLPLRWLAGIGGRADRAWLVTRGAQPVRDSFSTGARWQAPLWGIGRTFALEQPQAFGGLVDLPVGGSQDELVQTLLTALDTGDGEDQTAWRDGVRLAPRLVPAPAPAHRPVTFRPDATYLITGGFGGIGLLVARWMAEHGARHIALLGRHPDTASNAVRGIVALGARVIPLAGDVADEAAMQAAFARLAEEPPLRGIMHAAAGFGAAPIGVAMPADLEGTIRPKIDGTVQLERQIHVMELDFFVFFSSAATVLGAAHYAHYAAANAFLDATAEVARRQGRRVFSANWGAWEAAAEKEQSFREGGLVPMPASMALDALGRVLTGAGPSHIVGRFDWSVLKPLLEARHPRPMLARVLPQPKVSDEAVLTKAPSSGFAEQLAQAPTSARRSMLAAFVRREVAAVLGIGPADRPIDPEAGFFALGMDSLTSVELKRRLERGTGRSLPSTLTFNYPNQRALTDFLAQEFEETVAPGTAQRAPDVPQPAHEITDLAELTGDEIEARLLARLKEVR